VITDPEEVADQPLKEKSDLVGIPGLAEIDAPVAVELSDMALPLCELKIILKVLALHVAVRVIFTVTVPEDG
jgi:hypothetical protein